jgi:glycosyltransferase involved in cell wall biosynthesis
LRVERGPRRLILLAPIRPAPSGNGLAMRCELFRRAAGEDFEVQTLVVPVAGSAGGGDRGDAMTEVAPQPAAARAGLRSLLAEPLWRARLSSSGALPRAARAASPGLVDVAARALGERRFDALHVMRAYMAPLGVALAERLGVAERTLDLDDDDVTVFARAHRDALEANAYERLLGAFGGLYGALCAASPVDALAIAERLGRSVEEVPNAVEIPTARARRAASELRLLLVANLTYAPNAQAARVLAREVLPRLQRQLGGRPLRLTLVGHAHTALESLASPAVRVCGFVEDLGPLYAEADVVVAPLPAGGGTRIKLLEAFAYGVPVVTTPAGAEGLAVADGRELLLGADAQEIAAAVAALASDSSLRARLVEQAGRLVRERYSHDAVIPRVRAFLAGAARAGGATQAVLSS